ncbi:papain-like cysteine protease family protein [Streptomyces anandii]|uniref:Papain-like cysteine protease family protein n=1 Tax=Streptomyces anandii TaxID=285454 RepID=A0ABW6H9W3_9ACTN
MQLVPPRWKPARLAAAAVCATLLAAAPTSAVAAEHSATKAAATAAYASNSLPISMQTQEQNQWCWVASGDTIATYLGYGTDQNSFCDLARGYPTSYQCPNEAGYLSWDQNAFQALGLRSGYETYSPVSFSQIVYDIDNNHPEETGISWTSGGGHAEVIYGYDSTAQTIYFADPWPSDQRYNEMTYSDYSSNYEFYWDDTVYEIGA